MGKELYENRKKEFIDYINKTHNLPVIWEHRFSDTADMRLWFNKIRNEKTFGDFVKLVRDILSKYNAKILSEEEKVQQFLDIIGKINRIPNRSEFYFTDNDEMHSWYMTYRKDNIDFERVVRNSLREYQEFNIAEVWPDEKEAFMKTIISLKRVPNYGVAYLDRGIDIRAIYDKLETYDSAWLEQFLLHLETHKFRHLSLDDRLEQLRSAVLSLGYTPGFQEVRFSDNTDMYTWLERYRKKYPNLVEELNSLVERETPKTNVNLYFIPQFRKTGGNFYVVASNVGERLDISDCLSYEDLVKKDSSVVKRGGIILKKDEQIASVTYKKGRR